MFSAPMEQSLEGVHLGFLRQVTKFKEKILRDILWRKVVVDKLNSGSGDKTTLDLLGQEAGYSGGMGGLAEYL